MNIDEVIADARAEEEVAQEKATDFRDALKDKLRETFTGAESTTVTIPLHEYITLTNRSLDLDRVLNAIMRSLRLGYNGEYLRLDDDLVLNTFRALYPDVYAALYEKAKANAKEGE